MEFWPSFGRHLLFVILGVVLVGASAAREIWWLRHENPMRGSALFYALLLSIVFNITYVRMWFDIRDSSASRENMLNLRMHIVETERLSDRLNRFYDDHAVGKTLTDKLKYDPIILQAYRDELQIDIAALCDSLDQNYQIKIYADTPTDRTPCHDPSATTHIRRIMTKLKLAARTLKGMVPAPNSD